MRVLLTGASGQLGAYLLDRLIEAGHDLLAWSGSTPGRRGSMELLPIDLTDRSATLKTLHAANPDVILHLAAISQAGEAFRDPARAHLVNVEATRVLADWAAAHDRRLIFTSTDLVFDGTRPWNREDDPPAPILVYGRTKQQAERFVLAHPTHLVARVSLLYGFSRCGRPSFFDQTLDALRSGQPRTLFEDEYRTPLDYSNAAEILARLVDRPDVTGILHVAGAERLSRFDLIQRAAISLGIDPQLVHSNRQADATFPEPRPADVSLDTTRLASIFPDLRRPSIEKTLRTC